MSDIAYRKATEILSNPKRWVADEGNRLIVIYQERDTTFLIGSITKTNPPYLDDGIVNSLWFSNVESAKRYARNEMYVESRFKKS
ncbi:hypothetical protein [Paenibacillus sp. IHBB 3054]|uniref:hypothetical protein n=1 Tax=Paenibacillus sp. IHBB 3054 TaxID=3425689 RepID=UPI003F66A92A